MKKFIFPLLLIPAIILVNHFASADIYKGQGFTMEYPSDWKVYKKSDLVLFTSTRSEEITVKWESLKEFNLTFNDYVGISIIDVEEKVVGGVLEQSETGYINGKMSTWAILRAKNVKYKQYYINAYPRVFIITYTCSKKSFKKNLPKAENIMRSIKLK